jgi:hypothetical protein
MATVKVNKDKLKRMMGQKDVVIVNLGKRRKQDSASKQASEEADPRPPLPSEPVLLKQIPTPYIELIEPSNASSSNKAVEKAPNLPKDASLALR